MSRKIDPFRHCLIFYTENQKLMATIDNKGMVRGTAGSVVYRAYRKKNIIQGKPRKFKQTRESIKASTEFGLSSSTAAVIRQAFQPAYVHRDGEAVSRSTQLVYRGIRASRSGKMGQRDIHDADLSSIIGMDFNNNSPLAQVLQTSIRTERDPGGKISVFMAALNATTDIHGIPASCKQALSKYHIRFSLIGFNFRQEYYEHLAVRDVVVGRYGVLEEQEIRFEAQPAPDQLLLLSVSLLAYSETRMEEGYVLLNSKAFSPCALIAAYPAGNPGEYPTGPVNMEISPDQQSGEVTVCLMGYDGNRLLRDLARRMRTDVWAEKVPVEVEEQAQPFRVGEKVSFSGKVRKSGC